MLARTKLSEQDLIVTLLAEDGSQLRAVAKGARKPGGRLASKVELFCETDLLIAQGRSLDIISEAALINAHSSLRGDLVAVSAASAISEIARYGSFEDMPDALLFPLTQRALHACEQAHDEAQLELVVAAYIMKLLSHGGWRPELQACTACGEPDVSYLSARAGGALCASCVQEDDAALELREGEREWIGALVGSTFDVLLEAPLTSDLAERLLAISHMWAAAQLDIRLRALEFLRGL